jgi:hypothetical protein
MADINDPTTGNPLHYYLQMIPTNSRLEAAAAAASKEQQAALSPSRDHVVHHHPSSVMGDRLYNIIRHTSLETQGE